MSKKIHLFYLLFFFIACNTNKKQANAYLEIARKLYEQGEYASAKNNIDSISVLFPREFGIQRQGLQLGRRIEMKEQELNLNFCDSMLPVRIAEAEAMKAGFLFEKNPDYDEIGKYMVKSQQVEAKLGSSYIRTQVNEAGEILFSSVYYGSRPIQHARLKVSKSTGEYTETQAIPQDGGFNYTFVDGGMTTEVVTYTKGKDSGVIQFIYDNKGSTLKAELFGKTNYSFTISAADKNALAKTVDFAVILSDIDKLKKEIEKSTQRIQYLEGKIHNEL
jgi:hypothetical protein